MRVRAQNHMQYHVISALCKYTNIQYFINEAKSPENELIIG